VTQGIFFKENVQLHTMASAVARAYIGGLGTTPPERSRGKDPGGVSGAKLPEADDIYVNKSKICL